MKPESSLQCSQEPISETADNIFIKKYDKADIFEIK